MTPTGILRRGTGTRRLSASVEFGGDGTASARVCAFHAVELYVKVTGDLDALRTPATKGQTWHEPAL